VRAHAICMLLQANRTDGANAAPAAMLPRRRAPWWKRLVRRFAL